MFGRPLERCGLGILETLTFFTEHLSTGIRDYDAELFGSSQTEGNRAAEQGAIHHITLALHYVIYYIPLYYTMCIYAYLYIYKYIYLPASTYLIIPPGLPGASRSSFRVLQGSTSTSTRQLVGAMCPAPCSWTSTPAIGSAEVLSHSADIVNCVGPSGESEVDFFWRRQTLNHPYPLIGKPRR